MPVKIRLQRHGKKGKPFYWIVAADARSKRDGKFLEKLGIYNPNTNPATIDLNVNGSVQWLNNGAQPTDTARAILSYKGVLLKHHLLGGVRKGALTEEQAEEKFNTWVAEKEASVQAKKDGLSKEDAAAKAKALDAEKEFSDKRAAAALPEVEEEVVEESAPVVEEVAAEANETVEEAVAETIEAKEEVAEIVEEVKEEAPAAEAKTEEAAPEASEEEAPKE